MGQISGWTHDGSRQAASISRDLQARRHMFAVGPPRSLIVPVKSGFLSLMASIIENQGEGNPHDALTPTMSALIIVAHVKDGVDLAIKHKLNSRIVDVIREHHGDSLVYYLYRKAQERRRAEEDSETSSAGSLRPPLCRRSRSARTRSHAPRIPS